MPEVSGQQWILVFLKFPEPGKVKTRLARDLGAGAAAEAYRRLAEAVFGILAGVPGVRVRVLYDPPERPEEVRAWVEAGGGAGGWDFVPQEGDGLGERLERAFAAAFAEGAESVAAVGTDCIGISAGTFAAAWERLGSADAVFGPTRDGGYYLVALKAARGEIFRGIPWSAPETLEASLAAAEAAGLTTSQLEELADVDTLEDWEAVRERIDDG